jgi:putative RecB family exonuclease
MEVNGMSVYSHSRLQTFETCPLKYKYQYIDKLEKPVEETVEMFVGSRVHETLEKLYNDLHLEKLNSLDELVDYYSSSWKKEWNAGVKITREGFTEKHYFDYGVKCIRHYYERNHPFNQAQTLATELQLMFPLDDEGRYRMTGYIDRAARRADGTFEIHDYKTGGTPPSQESVDRDRQLALYQIGLKEKWPEAERVELIWHYVGRDLTLRSTRSADQLQELRQATIETIRRIEQEADFKPHQGAWCDWCEYQSVCPLWKHVVSVLALPPAQFAADEGVQLANQIADTKRQLDTLQRRYEQLKELIAEFCRQHGLSVVAGNGVRVRVGSQEQIHLPGKNEGARRELEDLLRRLGHWDEVAGLDVFELKRVIQDRLWPDSDLGQIQPFVSRDTSTVVTVRASQERGEE